MPDQLMAFTAFEAPWLVVIKYPDLTEVTGFDQPTDATYSCAFSVGGAFLAVTQRGDAANRVRIYNTASWEQEEVNGSFSTDTGFSQFDNAYPISHEVFLIELGSDGQFIVARDDNGVWQVSSAPSATSLIAYPYESGGNRKALLAEDTMVSSSGYEMYEYDVASGTSTPITLPARGANNQWYSATMAPDGKHALLMRQVGTSGSYEWDTLVLDTSDWSVAASDTGWVTEAGTGANSIEGAPQMTPDNSMIVLIYYDGTNGLVQAWDFPSMADAPVGDLPGPYLWNNLGDHLHAMAPDSSYAVVGSVEFSTRGVGKYVIPALDREAPFPFELEGEPAPHPVLIGNDSAHIAALDHVDGLIRVYDRDLTQVTTFTGTGRDDYARAASGELTYTLPTTPPEFWTDEVLAREIRRA